MEILIHNVKDFSKKEETLIIRDRNICFIEGNSCFERVLCKDARIIGEIESELSKIMFGWKEEYVGSRMVDGEKYHIVVEVNHKKKKYKIQNKFPDNWEEFLEWKEKIVEGRIYG